MSHDKFLNGEYGAKVAAGVHLTETEARLHVARISYSLDRYDGDCHTLVSMSMSHPALFTVDGSLAPGITVEDVYKAVMGPEDHRHNKNPSECEMWSYICKEVPLGVIENKPSHLEKAQAQCNLQRNASQAGIL